MTPNSPQGEARNPSGDGQIMETAGIEPAEGNAQDWSAADEQKLRRAEECFARDRVIYDPADRETREAEIKAGIVEIYDPAKPARLIHCADCDMEMSWVASVRDEHNEPVSACPFCQAILRNAYQWVEHKHPGYTIYDADGWRPPDEKPMLDLITESEFERRFAHSTVGPSASALALAQSKADRAEFRERLARLVEQEKPVLDRLARDQTFTTEPLFDRPSYSETYLTENLTCVGPLLPPRPLTADEVLFDVNAELERATRKFGPMASPHEGYAVILEELEEFWQAVKTKGYTREQARDELLQVAAMAVRCIVDCYHDLPEKPIEVKSWDGSKS